MITTICRIECDACGEGLLWRNYSISKTRMEYIARRKGWSIGKQHLCPKCRKSRKKKQSDKE